MTANSFASTTTEVIDAIDDELRAASKFLRFRVVDLSRQANIWKDFVEAMSESSSLNKIS